MPTYDYRCLDCRRRFDIYMTYTEYGTKPVVCAHCGSARVQRRVNRVRIGRSDGSRLASIGDPDKLDGIDEDPRALGRMMREMRSEVGEDMGPMFDEVVGRLEKGQSPEDIERDIPDLPDMAAGEGGMDDFDD